VEEQIAPKSQKQAAAPAKSSPIPLSQIPAEDSEKRICSGSEEFDRVLGGGIFPASVILLAGEPGIGKSTLMLQILLQLQERGEKTLYVSGEESLQQIKNRASRLRKGAEDLLVLAETDVNAIEYQRLT